MMRHTKRATKFITPEQRELLRGVSVYRGLFARVARELGLKENGRSHVRRVALGERRSKRIEAALHQALAEIERGTGTRKQRRAA